METGTIQTVLTGDGSIPASYKQPANDLDGSDEMVRKREAHTSIAEAPPPHKPTS